MVNLQSDFPKSAQIYCAPVSTSTRQLGSSVTDSKDGIEDIYHALQTNFPLLNEEATSSCWTVCIPRYSSVEHGSFTEQDHRQKQTFIQLGQERKSASQMESFH
ncbi:hypothetical protein AM593_09490, partial [Mytilus galloprovincialis]